MHLDRSAVETSTVPPMEPLKKPVVNIDKQGQIKWGKYEKEIVNKYELRCTDEEKETTISRGPQELQKVANDGVVEFSIKMEPPLVQPGHEYTIQVRSVNSQGFSEWSDDVIFRLKQENVPNAPQKPTITVHSGNEVTVSTLRLKEQESNGSPVTQCIVEYHIALGSQNWDRLSICLQNRNRKTVDVLVRSLSPNTLYNFRVRMVNDVGESEPSEYTQVITTVTIPGPPTELRASSKRAGKLIKIRWKKPEINPHAVAKYEAQVFNKKSQQWNTFKTVHCTKLSATAKDLETNTKYKFRVFAINSQDQSGD